MAAHSSWLRALVIGSLVLDDFAIAQEECFLVPDRKAVLSFFSNSFLYAKDLCIRSNLQTGRRVGNGRKENFQVDVSPCRRTRGSKHKCPLRANVTSAAFSLVVSPRLILPRKADGHMQGVTNVFSSLQRSTLSQKITNRPLRIRRSGQTSPAVRFFDHKIIVSSGSPARRI